MFLDFKINSLPVNLKAITNKMGIAVVSYTQAKKIFNEFEMVIFTQNNDGFCILVSNKWTIFYNDKIKSKGRIRFTIAHELGHIILEHRTETTIIKHCRVEYSTTNIDEWSTNKDEKEANMFASRILAPATVLHKINAVDCKTIMSVCGMSYTAANIRAERMQELIKRDMFDTHPLEKAVAMQFKSFIDEYNKKSL